MSTWTEQLDQWCDTLDVTDPELIAACARIGRLLAGGDPATHARRKPPAASETNRARR